LTYVGAIGRDLLRVSNILNPNPNFGQVTLTDNSATSNYQALQAKFERACRRGCKLWRRIPGRIRLISHRPMPLRTTSMRRTRSRIRMWTAATQTLTSATHSTYILPSPELSEFAHAALEGWSVDSFIFARTAPSVDVVGAIESTESIALYPRPDVVPGVPLVLRWSQFPAGKAFNPAAFTPPPTGRQGDFGRNVLRAFGAWQADVAFQREFHLIDKMGLRFRGEFFNLFNHPNFGPPDNNLTNPLFGQSTQRLASSLAGGNGAGFNPLYQIGGPHSVQLALKLQF
jgi:hypothetical protein